MEEPASPGERGIPAIEERSVREHADQTPAEKTKEPETVMMSTVTCGKKKGKWTNPVTAPLSKLRI